MHANMVGTPNGDRRVRDLEKESGAVLERAAVFVRPLVRAVLQELVGQVAVRPVNFDAVESGSQRILRAPEIFGDDSLNFIRLQRTRGDEFFCGRTRLNVPAGLTALGATGRAPSR